MWNRVEAPLTIAALDDKIQAAGGPVGMLCHAPSCPCQCLIRAEFANWRDEQEAWRCGAMPFDQSFHMTDFYVEGSDTRRLCEFLEIRCRMDSRQDPADRRRVLVMMQ